jgi:hypothetical protein
MKLHKDEILTGLMITGIIAVVGALAFGLHSLGKTVNWNLMYKGHATDLVCEMVKPEHLANPESCN